MKLSKLMNKLIQSKIKNLMNRLIINQNINKLEKENYNLKGQIKINLLILTNWVLLLILKFLLFHNSISKSHKVIHLIIILGEISLLKDNFLIEKRVEKKNLNPNLNLDLNQEMYLIKGFLEERCTVIVNKKHQIKFIRKSRNLLWQKDLKKIKTLYKKTIIRIFYIIMMVKLSILI